MATNLFSGLILHFVGDYLMQNDWIAARKSKSTLVCLLHCVLYSAPFLLITDNFDSIVIIFLSHFIIDRFSFAVLWIRLINWNWKGDNYGFSESKPLYLTTWILIITDNTFHVLINSLSIAIG